MKNETSEQPLDERSGVKFDDGKPRMDLLPWRALRGVAEVLGYGAKKYTPDGWRTVENAHARYTSALLRHLGALAMGETRDPESGLRHIDHIATNALFLAELSND